MRDSEKPFDDEDLERGRKVFSLPCSFVLGAVSLEQIPSDTLPEVCFAGRSNVGKSSLINALTGTRRLARTSDTPGRTQELNFFRIEGHLSLADLPGYGFAKAPKNRVVRWTRLTNAYLRGRPNLRRVLLLIDSRHGIKDKDREVMKMLDEAAVNYQVILTKADKISAGQQALVLAKSEETLSRHVAAHPLVLLTSSETALGLDRLRAEIAQFAMAQSMAVS